jgi:serine/threonine protein kinase
MAGVLHCDLKPDNIVRNRFGDAQQQENALSVHNTKGFTAPEVVCGGSNTCASDAYSVGATLLFLVKSVGEGDRSIWAIAKALTTEDHQSCMMLDQAYEKLMAQVESTQPRPHLKRAKKDNTGENQPHASTIDGGPKKDSDSSPLCITAS